MKYFLIFAFLNFNLSANNGPCQEDREKLCKNTQPGKGAIIKCLHEHESELSPQCKEHRQKMKESFKEVKQDCHEDVEKLCNDVTPGHGKVMKCLKEKKEEVSTQCKAELKDFKKERHKK